MRADEIRELTDDEVRSRVAELEEERFRLRFRAATETLESPLRLRSIRRDVARLKTVLRERQLGVNAAAAGEGAAATTTGKAAARGRGSRARRSASTRKTTGSRAGGAKGR